MELLLSLSGVAAWVRVIHKPRTWPIMVLCKLAAALVKICSLQGFHSFACIDSRYLLHDVLSSYHSSTSNTIIRPQIFSVSHECLLLALFQQSKFSHSHTDKPTFIKLAHKYFRPVMVQINSTWKLALCDIIINQPAHPHVPSSLQDFLSQQRQPRCLI